MELNDKVNEEYKQDKVAYNKMQKAKSIVEKLAKDLKMAKREEQDAAIREIRAKEDNDKEGEKEAKLAKEAAQKKVEQIKTKIEKLQGKLQESHDKVDSYINELKKDPEFENHLNSILEKRYNRKLKAATQEKAQVENIIALCKAHPTLSNNLKGMIRAQEELEKLKEELEPLDIEKDKVKIEKISGEIRTMVTKKENNSNLFIAYCEKNNVNVSKEFLEKLVEEKGFARDKQGNIKLESTLNNISKGYTKQIKSYQKAIEKVPNAKVFADNRVVKEEIQTPLSVISGGDLEKEETSELPVPKFKWYEFRKRFNAWRERKAAEKQDKKVEEESKDEAAETKVLPIEEVKQKASDKFREAYKYDIVKDYVDAQEKNIYKEASKEVRKEKSNEDSQER